MPQRFVQNSSVSIWAHRWLVNEPERYGDDLQDYILRKAGAELIRNIMLTAKYGEKNDGCPEYISGWREQGLDDMGKYKIYLKGPIEITTMEDRVSDNILSTVECRVDKVRRDKKYDNRKYIGM